MKKKSLMKSKKIVIYTKKEFCTDEDNDGEFKLYHKVRDHCHYTRKYRRAAQNICNLRYKIPKKIPVVFHNGSTYDYHFITKKLVEEFKGKVDCLGENMEKCITFSVPINKELNNNKVITYKLKFIDNYRFMPTSLSNLVDNLSEINNKDCKKCMEREKIISKCKFIGYKNNRLNYKCKKCNNKYAKSLNELLKSFLIHINFVIKV